MEHCTVSYQNIDHAVALVRQHGVGALMSKTDIENVFRLVPVSPADYDLLGFCIEGSYYYDKTLPMGLSMSCNLFEQFSSSLHWIAENKLHISGCAHIIDDFFFVNSSNYAKALDDLNRFLELAKELGVPIKQEKTFLPCTTLSFVGIEIDSINMEIRLPQDKIDKVKALLAAFKKKKKVTLYELQSAIGLLSFACAVVSP